MQSEKSRARACNSDVAKFTIVLNLPDIRFAVLTSAFDSLRHLDITLSSATSLVLATYVACVLAWNIVSFALGLLVQAAVFALISCFTFIGFSTLCTPKTIAAHSCFGHTEPNKRAVIAITANPSLPLLSIIPSSKSVPADGAAACTAKVNKVMTSQRHVFTRTDRSRLFVNVLPGDMRRRIDANLGKAKIRVGKAFVHVVSSKVKPCDIYVVRIDCGSQSVEREKHMNPVIMWDVTASFDEFKKLERELKKELKTKKQFSDVKVPHLSSGAVLFKELKLTDDVLNARRARLQTFIDSLRSHPVLSTSGSLRKFCQAY
ncbi:uncharacterized protein CCR75_005031 [Bremia lactucae]|uniref:PX domain-containing protein n=1 Tax=Bremia lactucae TaxID=4779 RepID=A0A976FEJ9_BRELC|nr:hypothetical protein CCR75_005031 [Bremia lactucae]